MVSPQVMQPWSTKNDWIMFHRAPNEKGAAVASRPFSNIGDAKI
jgi:hypothetical protein